MLHRFDGAARPPAGLALAAVALAISLAHSARAAGREEGGPTDPPQQAEQARQAEQGAGVPVLPSVQVVGGGVRQSVDKLNGRLRDTPQSVTVIDEERMREQNLYTLDDVMAQTPGITSQSYTLLTNAYYSRGFKVDSFEENGVPVLMGQTAAPSQNVDMYERVEVLRGASGLLHGSGNPAATINLVTKRPQREFAAQGSLMLGSWNRRRAAVDVGGPLNRAGTLRARVVASQEDRDFFYDVAGRRTGSIYAVAELDLAPSTVLSVGAQHQRIRSQTYMSGVPMYQDGGDIGLPRSTWLNVDWDHFDWDTTRVFASLEHVTAGGWEARLAANALHDDSDLKYAMVSGAIDRSTGQGARLSGAAYRFENRQRSLDAYLKGPFSLLGREHEAIVGANYQYVSTEQFNGSFATPLPGGFVDIFQWDPHSVPEPAVTGYSSNGPTRTRQAGVYAAGRFSLTEGLKLIAGARVSRWEQETPSETYRLSGEVTPYGGLIYALDSRWALYASYAEVFQPQNRMTWNGDLIDPLEGSNVEAGIKGELADGALNVSLAAFRIRQRNRAEEDPAHPCTVGNNYCYVASGEVVSKGLELEVAGRVTPRLSVFGGYTWNVSEYTKAAVSQGQPFARFTPRHILRAWGQYTLPWDGNRWRVGAGVQVQSRVSTVSGAATARQGGLAVANMSVSYAITPKIDAALNVNNVFDRKYYQNLGTVRSYYAEPRNIMLTLRASY